MNIVSKLRNFLIHLFQFNRSHYWSGHDLFVSNIPDTLDEKALYAAISSRWSSATFQIKLFCQQSDATTEERYAILHFDDTDIAKQVLFALRDDLFSGYELVAKEYVQRNYRHDPRYNNQVISAHLLSMRRGDRRHSQGNRVTTVRIVNSDTEKPAE